MSKDIKNPRVQAIANERAAKLLPKLETHFITALKAKRMPTEKEVDALVDAMVSEDNSGLGEVKVIENKEWYVTDQILPLMEVLVSTKGTKAERVAALIGALYDEEILKHLDETDAAQAIASDGAEW